MKRILYIIAFAAALFAASSCVEPLASIIPSQDQDLRLSFSCGALTKATVAGEGNENLVKRIDYFVFPYGTDGKVADDAEYVYSNTITTTDANKLALTYEETISRDNFDLIFPNGNTKAVVFAVANYVDYYGDNNSWTPTTTIPADAKTWAALHNLEVGATFFYDDYTPDFGLRWPHTLKPTDDDLYFVMVADSAVVNLVASGDPAVNGIVPLERLASKVTVNFTYEPYVVEPQSNGDITWVPQSTAGETRVYLSNAIEHTTLGGPLTRDLVPDSKADQTKPNGTGKRDIFEYAYNFMNEITTLVDGKKTAHFYTYPISFEEGDDNQPYLKLVLPWYGYKYKGSGTAPAFDPATSPNSSDWEKCKQKEVYYKIVLPRETITEPNRIYEYSVHVNIIGSDKEVMVPGYDYVVKDWLSGEALESNVAMARYISLDIPKDKYDMYGDEVEILYVSSGEVEITKLQISSFVRTGTGDNASLVTDWFCNDDFDTQPSYDANGNPIHNYTKSQTATVDAVGVTLPNWVKLEGSKLVIDHTMNADINLNTVNIFPFTFKVRLHLKGENGRTFDRDVTITQYPPIYVQVVPTSNMNTVFLNNTVYDGSANRVNNNKGESMGYIGNSQGAKTRTIVSVTTLANLDVTKYTNLGIDAPVIGDPRITLAESLPENPYVSGESWGEEDLGNADNDYIKNYRYTDINKTNVIAPKFMLASGYGGCNGNKVDWVHNVERCASYQEDGYPAGRWRLPTEAEIVFVYTLANDLGLLPNPYFTDSHYWANAGRQFYNAAFNTVQHGTSGQNATGWSSRCVYDLWYWGDDPVLTATTNPSITQWSGYMTTK